MVEPLKIQTIENIETNIQRINECPEIGLIIYDANYDPEAIISLMEGGNWEGRNTMGHINFGDGTIVWGYIPPTPLSIALFLFRFSDNVPFSKGETITIIYDGGQKVTIYLPYIPTNEVGEGEPESPAYVLFVAKDGSTYYDRELTQLASSKPSILSNPFVSGVCGAIVGGLIGYSIKNK